MPILPASFYRRPDVSRVARGLLGKFLFTRLDGGRCGGRIVEVEAYAGVEDRASHAHGGRRTARNESMYGPGGTAYVFFCYGMHSMFNVVTGAEGVPDAVLVRALEPVKGLAVMTRRRGLKPGRRPADSRGLPYALTAGPGALCRALGITRALDGLALDGRRVWIEDRGVRVPASRILARPRVGVAYAGEHAGWPLRFSIRDSPWVSRAK